MADTTDEWGWPQESIRQENLRHVDKADRLSALREEIANITPWSAHRDNCSIWNSPNSTIDDCNCPVLNERLDAIMQAFGRETGRLVDDLLAKLPEKTHRKSCPAADIGFCACISLPINEQLDTIATLIASYRQEGTE